jgi:hypothetical protein
MNVIGCTIEIIVLSPGVYPDDCLFWRYLQAIWTKLRATIIPHPSINIPGDISRDMVGAKWRCACIRVPHLWFAKAHWPKS